MGRAVDFFSDRNSLPDDVHHLSSYPYEPNAPVEARCDIRISPKKWTSLDFLPGLLVRTLEHTFKTIKFLNVYANCPHFIAI